MLQEEAAALVTLVAGTLAVTWRDIETYLGSSIITVALEYAPQEVWCQRVSHNGSTALGELTITAITATGCTITARNPTDATVQTNDISQVRVYARCRPQRPR